MWMVLRTAKEAPMAVFATGLPEASISPVPELQEPSEWLQRRPPFGLCLSIQPMGNEDGARGDP